MTDAKKTSESTVAIPEQLRIRREKRDRLLKVGIQSYPVEVLRTHSLKDVREEWSHLEAGEETQDVVTVIGRVMFIRNTGKFCFAALQEGDGTTLQTMLSKAEVGGDALTAWKADVDMGDFVFITDHVTSSRRGELSVMTIEWQMVSKALRPLPASFTDLFEDSRVRHRCADLIMREQARTNALTRIKVIRELYYVLERHGFPEAETPMPQTLYGGAAARPFIAHSNALDINPYLRIASKLYPKCCVVGGIERALEINRNFRNEGIDSSYSPEFAMLEYHKVFGTYDDSACTVREAIQEICVAVFGSTTVTPADGTKFDFGGEWKQIEMYPSPSETLARKFPGRPEVAIDSTVEKLKAVADMIGLEVSEKGGWGHSKLVEKIWRLLCEDQFDGPAFVHDFPVETSPLTRQHRFKPGVTEKWDLYVRGFELAIGYPELVDPVVQRERFEDQARLAVGGDDEAIVLDEDLLHVMEWGIPPTAGVGTGIDRLLMTLIGLSIRETMLFLIVKPEV